MYITGTAELVNQDVDAGYHDFLLHFGDVSCVPAQSINPLINQSRTHSINQSMLIISTHHRYALGQAWSWEQFFRMIQPYATRIPYMISIGNHGHIHITSLTHSPHHIAEYDHISGGQNDPSGAAGSG